MIFGFYVHNAGDSISTKNCRIHINVYQRNRNATKPTTRHHNVISPKYILENKPQLTNDGNNNNNINNVIDYGDGGEDDGDGIKHY